jgi:hypothetical protein
MKKKSSLYPKENKFNGGKPNFSIWVLNTFKNMYWKQKIQKKGATLFHLKKCKFLRIAPMKTDKNRSK